ncbi:hypothetical protein F2Q68_00036201 [Brassica cretica]|uniref:Uncharacterized protein n=1 Tax=Brassica cretica TaxID=69181 RepID=A0A8S9H1Y6_BRACR|nr:hypothetical protein F2Q68_00036201 [Brassica cretica]
MTAPRVETLTYEETRVSRHLYVITASRNPAGKTHRRFTVKNTRTENPPRIPSSPDHLSPENFQPFTQQTTNLTTRSSDDDGADEATASRSQKPVDQHHIVRRGPRSQEPAVQPHKEVWSPEPEAGRPPYERCDTGNRTVHATLGKPSTPEKNPINTGRGGSKRQKQADKADRRLSLSERYRES